MLRTHKEPITIKHGTQKSALWQCLPLTSFAYYGSGQCPALAKPAQKPSSIIWSSNCALIMPKKHLQPCLFCSNTPLALGKIWLQQWQDHKSSLTPFWRGAKKVHRSKIIGDKIWLIISKLFFLKIFTKFQLIMLSQIGIMNLRRRACQPWFCDD